MTETAPRRCGFVAIVGRPNVGKSTLLNRLLGRKLSITSRKPQTTRHRILGVRSGAAFQVAFVDTPGLHADARRALNRYMNRTASAAMAGVDVILLVIEALRWTEGDALVLGEVEQAGRPVVVAVNKVDRVRRKALLLPFLEETAARGRFEEIIPVSAVRGDNVERLEAQLVARLPEGEPLFPEGQLTDRGDRFLAAEIIREKLTWRLGREVPYRLSVEIEQFEMHPRLLEIGALIWVERPGQKAIVVGRRGAGLKETGTRAREELERLFGRRIYLRLWVKVKENWSDDERLLQQMGYQE